MVRIWISSHFIPLPFFSFFLAIHVAVAAFVGWCLATFLEESFNQPEMAEFLGHLKLGRNGHLPNLSHVLYGIHPLNQSRHFRENNLVELIESLRINLYDLYGWWYFFWCFNQIKNHHQIERVINQSTNQPSGNHQSLSTSITCRSHTFPADCPINPSVVHQESQPDSGQRDWRSAALARGTGPSAVEKSAGSFDRGNPLTQSSSECKNFTKFHQSRSRPSKFGGLFLCWPHD